MITLIAYWLTIQLILTLFFNVDRSMIYCGIAAFNGKKRLSLQQKQKIYTKMKILGLFNQTRGEDGCGIYINGVIHKGHNEGKVDTKTFQSFITQKDWVLPIFTKGNVIILHTRKASYGAKTAANNHPFYIETENGANDIIGKMYAD